MIDVRVVLEGPPRWECRVTVTSEDGSQSAHEVTVDEAELDRWGGAAGVPDLVRRSFEFLLRREPKESILRRFELSAIQRYFPEYDGEIRLQAP